MRYQTRLASSAWHIAPDCQDTRQAPRAKSEYFEPYRVIRLAIFLMLIGFWMAVITRLF
jgi:hypothetical protein